MQNADFRFFDRAEDRFCGYSLPENEYFLKSGNRIMTEDTDCVNICLKIILPKNRKNSKSGNRGWHHAAYSKKKVFR